MTELIVGVTILALGIIFLVYQCFIAMPKRRAKKKRMDSDIRESSGSWQPFEKDYYK